MPQPGDESGDLGGRGCGAEPVPGMERWSFPSDGPALVKMSDEEGDEVVATEPVAELAPRGQLASEQLAHRTRVEP
jgi:hypothetical protein